MVMKTIIKIRFLKMTKCQKQGLSRKYPAMYYEIEAFIEEDTRNIVHRTMMPQYSSRWAPWDLTQFSQLPSAAPPHFPESH